MVKFLVIRFSSIGDILLTTPVVRHLKEQVDESSVHYLTKKRFSPILQPNPFIDRVHTLDGDWKALIRELKQEGFDYIIDLHHNARSARIKLALKRLDFTVRKLNLRKWILVNLKIDRLPDIHLVDRNMETIKTFISERDGKGLDYFIPEGEEAEIPESFRDGFIGLAIGGQHETKKLPAESLVALVRILKHPVILLGGPEDRDPGEQIVRLLPGKTIWNSCGQLSLHQSASLVRDCRLLISHDTGLMHMGAAFGKKVISIWGNTVPKFGMTPYKADPRSVIFQVEGLSCRPCSKIGHARCPRKHFRCMREQDIGEMAATANRLFGPTGQ